MASTSTDTNMAMIYKLLCLTNFDDSQIGKFSNWRGLK